MDEPLVVHTHWEKFRPLLSIGALSWQATVDCMKAAPSSRSEETGSFSLWFALLSPVLGVAVGILGLLLFNWR
jgi:hypothetical protein